MSNAKTKVQAARERMRPAIDCLLRMDRAQCMEQSSDASGITIERWLLPNGVSVILYGTPDWWNIFAPITGASGIDETIAELQRLAARPAAKMPRAYFSKAAIDEHPELGAVRDVLLRDHCSGVSITNDADAVVAYVASVYPGRRIFYIDTDGNCDELLHVEGRFLNFAPARGRYA